MAQESTGTGKWAEAGVPHRGWSCLGVDDVEDALELCQMCEAREVRFVHVMENPRYPNVLRVGKVCAGHMEGDVDGALLREREFKNIAARRANWVTRTWRTSAQGNSYVRADGFHVTRVSTTAWGLGSDRAACPKRVETQLPVHL